MAAKKKAAGKRKSDGRGRPERVRGGGSAAQLVVRLSKSEGRELDEWATRNGMVRSEVVRMALRNMGVISAPVT